jgi:HAD superfamily hydrolase (TIGR01450 family)
MLLLVDLDGVVYRGSRPVPGVAAVLAARVAAGDDVVYVTNNSMWYRTDYLARLTSMGAPVSPDRIVSSARATALYLAESDPPPHLTLVVGGEGLMHEMRDAGLAILPSADAAATWAANDRNAGVAVGGVDAVVVGLDLELTYGKLAVAAEAIRAGARFVATNRDPIYPQEHGFMPGAGSIVAAIAAATAVEPVSIGKPAPLLLEVAARAAGHSVGEAAGGGAAACRTPSDAVMIGDSLVTDMPAARAVGARSVLMLTGATSRAQLAALAPADRPTEVASDAAGLAAALDRLAAATPAR